MSRPGRPTGHRPANTGRIGVRQPSRTAIPVMRDLFALMDADDRSAQVIGARAGAHKVSISRWRHGASTPNALYLEALANVLGYRLALVPLSVMTDDSNEQSGQTGPSASD